MPNYLCEYCGMSYTNPSSLTACKCPRHPSGPGRGFHKLYEGQEKKQYICRFCGYKFSSIRSMTALRCPRHPDGNSRGCHSPML